MSLRLPLLIGVSGKRIFDKDDPARDELVSQWVRQRFDAIFAKLDDEFPQTPKIVLTGAAFGTDTIAAEAALERNKRPNGDSAQGWAVAAIPPFDRALFAEDFQQGSSDPQGEAWRVRFEAHAAKFQSLVGAENAPPPQVLVRELPKLDTGEGTAATFEQLTRSNTQYRELRDNHYEQVGQFIAESATILIAAMPHDGPADTEHANGGTARVVAYRRAGRADEVGVEIANRSQVLRGEWSDLLAPPARDVWLIDTAGYPAQIEATQYPVTVLPPLSDRSVQDTYAKGPANAMPTEQPPVGLWRRLLTTGPATPTQQRARERQLRASLVLAQALERLHGFIKDDSRVIADVSPSADIARSATQARELINDIQVAINRRARRAFSWVAFLFVCAILSFEVYAKFTETHGTFALSLYVIFFVVIGLIVYVARRFRWQSISDDYRAVAEMLRIQQAWWSAGLTERVDREHLQGADPELGRIRDAFSMLTVWLLLRRGWSNPIHLHWKSVFDPSAAPGQYSDWIGGQVDYFSRKSKQRENSVLVTDAISWTLFVASGCLAAIVLSWLPWHHALFDVFKNVTDQMRPLFARWPSADFIYIIWFVTAAAMVGLRVLLREVKGPWKTAWTLIFGFATACFFAAGWVSAPLPLLKNGSADVLTIKSFVTIGLVVMSAIAGALRYRTERLNVEAEAHEYHDAHERFERAEHALKHEFVDGTPRDVARAQAIVHELGLLALTENEAWLKSRRERPLTPVVG